MTTAKKAASSTNNSTVTISAPKIEKAWSDLVVQTTTSEQGAIRACLDLAREMKKSQLSIRDIQKAIKQTGLESPFVKVSHVEGLPSMLALQKVEGFSALPLAKQLSTATASYKLLGAGIGEQMPSLEALETEIARERKEKNSKKSEPKADKPSKAKATPADTLKSILAFIEALDFQAITEAEADIVTEIYTVIEAKTLQLA
jgi:LysM repeat protein